MKKLFLLLILPICLTSCKSCMSSYEERRAGVQKVCPKCTYFRSENLDFAVDTTTQPNKIYKVSFCNGGLNGYKASDVDHLTVIQ